MRLIVTGIFVPRAVSGRFGERSCVLRVAFQRHPIRLQCLGEGRNGSERVCECAQRAVGMGEHGSRQRELMF